MEVEETETRQDSKAEIALADLFKLNRVRSRMDDKDALDETGNPFELKGSTKSGISTARSFGPNTIYKYRRAFIIIGWGRNYRDRFEIDHTYFMSRQHIDPWLIVKENHFEREISKANHVIETCRAAGYHEPELQQIQKTLYRGMRINDPNIPKKYVLKHGIQIIENHAEHLRRLVIEYPLT